MVMNYWYWLAFSTESIELILSLDVPEWDDSGTQVTVFPEHLVDEPQVTTSDGIAVIPPSNSSSEEAETITAAYDKFPIIMDTMIDLLDVNGSSDEPAPYRAACGMPRTL